MDRETVAVGFAGMYRSFPSGWRENLLPSSASNLVVRIVLDGQL